MRTYTLTPGRRYSFGCRYRLGTASNGDVRQRGRQRLRGRHQHLPRHALAGRLEHAPGLLGPPGGIAKLHFGAFGGSIPRLVQQSAGTLDLYSMQIRASAFEGESVSETDLWRTRWPLRAWPCWTRSPRRATWACASTGAVSGSLLSKGDALTSLDSRKEKKPAKSLNGPIA